MNDLAWLGLASGCFACLASVGARCLRDFSRSELAEVCERHERQDRWKEILGGHDRAALAAEMLAAVAAAVLVAALIGGVWAAASTPPALPTLLAEAVLGGLLVATLTAWLPWSVSRLAAAAFVFHTWWVWRGVVRLSTPLVLIAKLADAVLHRLAGKTPEQLDEESLEEEIRTIVSEGHREGLLKGDAREMIEGVMELSGVDVDHIMTPRTDMHMLQVDTPWAEMLADVIAAGHTRIPVYDTSRDDLVGVLYVKDLLPELSKPPGEPYKTVRQLVRKPELIPESLAVNELLQMFRRTRTHIAIVLDEYGGVAGLVTIEDVLEEIVGEIVDEYDAEEEAEFRLDGEVCIALGRAHVDEINEALGVELPEDGDYDTIGGFVFTELGRVPTPGDKIEWRSAVRVTVTEVSKRRIERVRIERLESAESRESA